MSDADIKVGDLVTVKEELQKLVDIRDWGIAINETTILPTDLPENENIDPIDSLIVFFPSTDDTFTIPRNCLRKICFIVE